MTWYNKLTLGLSLYLLASLAIIVPLSGLAKTQPVTLWKLAEVCNGEMICEMTGGRL